MFVTWFWKKKSEKDYQNTVCDFERDVGYGVADDYVGGSGGSVAKHLDFFVWLWLPDIVGNQCAVCVGVAVLQEQILFDFTDSHSDKGELFAVVSPILRNGRIHRRIHVEIYDI